MNAVLVSHEDKISITFRWFTAAMNGRHYGAEETLDAWLWFKTGFLSHEKMMLTNAVIDNARKL